MLQEIDLFRIDLKFLPHFDTARHKGYVGRAANRSNRSPSAVSHRLGRLRRTCDEPLFLRTPIGIVPAARALDMAVLIADILARMRVVFAGAVPSDPAQSTRCFVIGKPGAVSGVAPPSVLVTRSKAAPASNSACGNFCQIRAKLYRITPGVVPSRVSTSARSISPFCQSHRLARSL